MNGAVQRPVLRYHGGKFRIAPWIIAHLPAHRIYVEPFGGAASVLMRKPRSFAEVYNDLDGDVVNLFRVLRDPVLAQQLRAQVELTPFAREEFVLSYEPTQDPVERARRTVARGFMSYGSSNRRANRTGFRGRAYRQNATGANDWTGWPDHIPSFVERLRGVTIDNRDAFELIAQQDSPDTLFYCDPPYLQELRTSIRWSGERDRAYAHELGDEDHCRLLETLGQVAGMVVLSGYRSSLYDSTLGSGWESVEKDTLADGAVARTEVLWLNPAAWARLYHKGSLFEECRYDGLQQTAGANGSPLARG